jgi:hypothetical protein
LWDFIVVVVIAVVAVIYYAQIDIKIYKMYCIKKRK